MGLSFARYSLLGGFNKTKGLPPLLGRCGCPGFGAHRRNQLVVPEFFEKSRQKVHNTNLVKSKAPQAVNSYERLKVEKPRKAEQPKRREKSKTQNARTGDVGKETHRTLLLLALAFCSAELPFFFIDGE